MYKQVFFVAMLFGLIVVPGLSLAQGMMGNWSPTAVSNQDVNQTSQEETTGKNLWTQLQNKQKTCSSLRDEDFDSLGEYFMGQMMGSTAHANMNASMKAQLGDAGETQMHVALGKRLSNCDANAAFSANGQGFANMFGMMSGGGSMMGNFNDSNLGSWGSMMNRFSGATGAWGWIWMILVWALIIIVAVAVWRSMARNNHPSHSQSALDVLKERYAKGEIEAKEFQEKKALLEK